MGMAADMFLIVQEKNVEKKSKVFLLINFKNEVTEANPQVNVIEVVNVNRIDIVLVQVNIVEDELVVFEVNEVDLDIEVKNSDEKVLEKNFFHIQDKGNRILVVEVNVFFDINVLQDKVQEIEKEASIVVRIVEVVIMDYANVDNDMAVEKTFDQIQVFN